MPKLKHSTLKKKTNPLRTSEVPIPSFGDDMVCIVREMTVGNRNLLAFHTMRGHDAMSVIAALSAVDEEGNLAFGRNSQEAIAAVEGLREKHRNDIAAIGMEALRLSGVSEQETETAVAEAEKN